MRMRTNHCGENVCQGPSELEHYDHDGDGDVHDSAQSCTRTQEGICSRSYAGNIGLAGGKKGGIRERFMDGLDEDADHTPEGGSNRHRRHEDACGHLAAVR